MCGIFGFIGQQKNSQTLINGLKRLEYRGYDSAGFCLAGIDSLVSYKAKGKVAELENNPAAALLSSRGIAHTRWATHGQPDEINAHPHLDCRQKIALVHNGIIENYQALKKVLLEEGHQFVSETDSEVLVHLIEKFYQGDLAQAVAKALKLVEGSYGLAIMSLEDDKLVVARKGSPLILGLGEGEMFVASDASALLEHTAKVIYLNDGEMAVLAGNDYQVLDLEDGQLLEKEIEKIKWNIAEIEKGGYKHFMLKEIFEQPQSLKNVLAGRIRNGRIKLSVKFNPREIKRIIITACGTSWHSGLIGKYLLEKLTGLPVEVDYASEFRYRNPIVEQGDLAIAISQSGETADTLAALREAREKGAQTLGIVNTVGSTIAREVDSGIYLYAGPEIGVASTKAFTSQVAALLLVALWLAQERKEPHDKNLVWELENIWQKVEETLAIDGQLKNIAERFKDTNNFLYLGRGLNFPVALEGALKLKEISYVHAEGYPAAEIKHGPIALIDENMPVVFLATKNNLSQKTLSNMEEIKARQGIIIAVTNEGNQEVEKLSDYQIIVPEVADELSPIINVIPLQLLAYHIADLKNLDVDKPRNLAKSVTVE